MTPLDRIFAIVPIGEWGAVTAREITTRMDLWSKTHIKNLLSELHRAGRIRQAERALYGGNCVHLYWREASEA